MRLLRWWIGRWAPVEWRESLEGDLVEEQDRRRAAGQYAGFAWIIAATVVTTACVRRAATRESVGSTGKGGGAGWGHDLRLAARAWRRQPMVAAVIVLTLTLGIGANTAVFSVANWMMLRPVPGVADPGTLVTIRMVMRGGGFFFMSMPEVQTLRETPGLAGLAAQSEISVNLTPDGETPTRVAAHAVTTNYFEVLGQSMTMGRAFTVAEDDPGQALRLIVSHRYWTGALGRDPNVIGREVRINNASFTIIGVAADGFRGPSRSATIDFWLPLASHRVSMPAHPATMLTSPDGLFLSAYGRLAPGTSQALVTEQVEALRLRAVEANEGSSRLPRISFEVMPGLDVPSWEGERLRQTFGLLIVVVALILLLACANVANLLLARAHERQSEVATRMALGAGRGRVIRQWVMEGAVLCVLGGLGALGLSWVMGQALDGVVITKSVSPLSRVELDWRVFAFAAAAVAAACLGGSVLPAIVGSRVDLIGVLKQAGRGQAPAGRRVRRVLTVVQVGVSVVLLCGSFLLLRSMSMRYAVPLGYDTDQVLAFSVEPGLRISDSEARAAEYRALLTQLTAVPGVTDAGLAWIEPFKLIGGGFNLRPAGVADAEEVGGDSNMVSAGFFSTLGVRILAGRTFTPTEEFRPEVDGSGVLIVNETLARRVFGRVDVAGRQVEMSYPKGRIRTIVGVVSDTRTRSLVEPVEPTAYEPFGQSYMSGWGTIHLRLTAPVAAVLPAVHQAVSTVDPALPIYNVETLKESLDWHLAEARLVTRVTTAFAVLATLLATIGLYGVLARGIAERRHEFSIRAALGARPNNIATLVMREALSLTLVGSVVGLAAAVWLGRYAESRLFGVTALDPRSLFASVVCVGALGLVVALPSVLRAIRVKTAEELRA